MYGYIGCVYVNYGYAVSPADYQKVKVGGNVTQAVREDTHWSASLDKL